MQQNIVLKVSEAFQQDVGYGRDRIDHQTRIDLDLSIGDIIEIEGTKITAASVWRAHPSDEGKKIIRIDNLTRKNAGTDLLPLESSSAPRISRKRHEDLLFIRWGET